VTSLSSGLPPVLLIHGLGSSFEHGWQATGWVDVLEGEGRDVVPVHLPGHGPGATTTSAVESATARIITAAAPYDQVDAVGFSAGAHALLGASSQTPEKFRRVVVMGIGDGLLEPPPPGPGVGEEIARGLETEDEPEADLPRIIRRMVDMNANDRAAVAAFLRTEGRRVTKADLERIRLPVLVVIGERDFAGPADGLVAALPDASHLVLKGTDHFATPSDFTAMDHVVRFLAE
jgi:pimeloyl-ACP methyl ester carboxylesterase